MIIRKDLKRNAYVKSLIKKYRKNTMIGITILGVLATIGMLTIGTLIGSVDNGIGLGESFLRQASYLINVYLFLGIWCLWECTGRFYVAEVYPMDKKVKSDDDGNRTYYIIEDNGKKLKADREEVYCRLQPYQGYTCVMKGRKIIDIL